MGVCFNLFCDPLLRNGIPAYSDSIPPTQVAGNASRYRSSISTCRHSLAARAASPMSQPLDASRCCTVDFPIDSPTDLAISPASSEPTLTPTFLPQCRSPCCIANGSTTPLPPDLRGKRRGPLLFLSLRSPLPRFVVGSLELEIS